MLRAYVQVDNLTNHQPCITVDIGDTRHVISIVTIRQLANGAEYRGNQAELIQLLATAIRDLTDELY